MARWWMWLGLVCLKNRLQRATQDVTQVQEKNESERDRERNRNGFCGLPKDSGHPFSGTFHTQNLMNNMSFYICIYIACTSNQVKYVLTVWWWWLVGVCEH